MNLIGKLGENNYSVNNSVLLFLKILTILSFLLDGTVNLSVNILSVFYDTLNQGDP